MAKESLMEGVDARVEGGDVSAHFLAKQEHVLPQDRNKDTSRRPVSPRRMHNKLTDAVTVDQGPAGGEKPETSPGRPLKGAGVRRNPQNAQDGRTVPVPGCVLRPAPP